MRLEEMTVQGLAHGRVTVDGDAASIHSFERTDWFFPPTGEPRSANVPRLVWEVTEPIFSLSARVSVEFCLCL